MDLILLGVMIRQQVPAETIVLVALANPLQAFRTAAFLLFDPQLVLLGASAFVILDKFGQTGYLVVITSYSIHYTKLYDVMLVGFMFTSRGSSQAKGTGDCTLASGKRLL